jgi:hypothetical protein
MRFSDSGTKILAGLCPQALTKFLIPNSPNHSSLLFPVIIYQMNALESITPSGYSGNSGTSVPGRFTSFGISSRVAI